MNDFYFLFKLNKINPKQIVWIIPIAYLLHLEEEYFTGFAVWFSKMFNVGLSLNNFILINTIGFIAVVAISILYSLNKVNNFVIAALGTLFIVNGIVHTMASVLTGTYSPGTLSGIVIYIPLVLTIFPFSSSGKRLASILAGIFI